MIYAVAALAPQAFVAPVAPRAPAVKVNMIAEDIDFGQQEWTTGEIKDKAGMEALAVKLNPAVGFWGARPPPRACSTPFRATARSPAPTAPAPAQTRLAS